jgi:hypothetical protein
LFIVIRGILHKAIDVVCDDLKENTLTNGAIGIGGGLTGGIKASRMANAGFTMLERQAGLKAVQGACKGAGCALGANAACSGTHGAGKPFKFVDKVGDIEKWFDNTSVGKAIDNEIAYVQHRSHAVIDRTFDGIKKL